MNQYQRSGILLAEEFSRSVSPRKWAHMNMRRGPVPGDIYRRLSKSGIYYPERFETYPAHIPLPLNTEPKQCHRNSMYYAQFLCENHPDIAAETHFVTGLYSLRATGAVPIEKEFVVVHHSFLTYKGIVLDCSTINHPPNCYEIRRYFGIPFPIPTILEVSEKLAQAGAMDSLPLIELQGKPHLKG